jgi:hypothetical protein
MNGAVSCCETMVPVYQITRRHALENIDLNLTSFIVKIFVLNIVLLLSNLYHGIKTYGGVEV